MTFSDGTTDDYNEDFPEYAVPPDKTQDNLGMAFGITSKNAEGGSGRHHHRQIA